MLLSYLFEFEGVFIGAAETAHVLQIGGGDRQVVVDVSVQQEAALQGPAFRTFPLFFFFRHCAVQGGPDLFLNWWRSAVL